MVVLFDKNAGYNKDDTLQSTDSSDVVSLHAAVLSKPPYPS
jgi:hypothetical protein